MDTKQLPIFSVIRLKKEIMLLGTAFEFSPMGASTLNENKRTAGYVEFLYKGEKFIYHMPYAYYEDTLISIEDMSKHMQKAFKQFTKFKEDILANK